MFSVLPDVVMSYLDCDSGSARRAAIIAFLAKGWHLALFDVLFFCRENLCLYRWADTDCGS